MECSKTASGNRRKPLLRSGRSRTPPMHNIYRTATVDPSVSDTGLKMHYWKPAMHFMEICSYSSRKLTVHVVHTFPLCPLCPPSPQKGGWRRGEGEKRIGETAYRGVGDVRQIGQIKPP
jgi:hypothetical protein